jgi:hypothetical protein
LFDRAPAGKEKRTALINQAVISKHAMKTSYLTLAGLSFFACMGTASGAVTFADNGSGGVIVTVTQQISIPLIAAPQGVSPNSVIVYINFEDVYSTGASSILTGTPGDYSAGLQASIDGVAATAYSTSGQRSTTSGIRDSNDLFVAFAFPYSVTEKGAGDVFILSPGSVTITAAPVPDLEASTIQLGGITGTTTLSDAVAVVPEPTSGLLCLIAGLGLTLRRSRNSTASL